MDAQIWIDRHVDRSAVILSPSTVYPGGWRLTRWDHVGPVGHPEHDTRAEALKRVSGEEYQPTDTEPPWLGLTVITNGRVEQC